jgi:dUTPase
VGGVDPFLPTQSETQRTGLTLKGRETAVIQQCHSVEVAAGLHPISFLRSGIRVTQSASGPGKREKIRAHTTTLTREDHGAEIVFTISNFGCDPLVVDREDRVGGNDLVIESREVSHTEFDLNTLDWVMAAPTAPRAEPQFQKSITMGPLDGTIGVHAEQPLKGKSSDYARITVDGHQARR